MMLCPVCTLGITTVIDSRFNETYQTIKRRRLCTNCAHRWSTLELDLEQVEALHALKGTLGRSTGVKAL